ncbi:hypothetical protein [Streptococcus sp. A34]|uniref:hypothetical protein n=1 Tax=Streptococcus sp. A34 TaxID=3373130 RepID=UPI00374D42A8
MKRIEWIAYFEATNGRKPTPAELQEAVKSGIVQSSKKSFPKWVYGLVGIVAIAGIAYMFFTNTSNQEISTISTGASSSTNQTKVSQSQSSSSQKEEDGIDLSAIQAGDYASIAGLWYTEISESPKEFNWSDYFKHHQVREENGILTLSINLAGAPALKIIPKGVEYNLPVETISGGVPTMTTTDRIVSEGIVSDVYYREADFKNVENTQYSISYHTQKTNGTVGDYQQVIDDNRTMLSTKSFNGLKYYSPEALEASELYYALYDFDQNGTNEFILAGKKNDTTTGVTTFDKLASWERTIYGVFTVQDKEIITLFNGIGYRTHVAPMTDGSFWLRGSGGYDTGVYEHYSFTDSGISVSKNLMITYENLGKSNEKIQDESGRDFTWEEVQAEINQYEILSSDVMIWNRL